MTEKELLAARQSIVQKLTQARLEKGLSQEQLAKRIGTQRSNICRIEKGTQNLSLDLMLKIAEALDKDVSVMLEERSSTIEKVYIREIHENKKQFLPLLLLADEQEDMIDRYLERGTMYVLEDGGVKAECVVTDEGGGILELKNLAVEPEAQRKGYGKALIDFLVCQYRGSYDFLQVGTGDSPLTVPFYEKCGFVRSHRIPNFFTDHYDHPIYEAGVRLVDMVYLRKPL